MMRGQSQIYESLNHVISTNHIVNVIQVTKVEEHPFLGTLCGELDIGGWVSLYDREKNEPLAYRYVMLRILFFR